MEKPTKSIEQANAKPSSTGQELTQEELAKASGGKASSDGEANSEKIK